MDEDAIMAVGTVLASLGGLLERAGVSTTHEFAETLGSLAMMVQGSGEQYHGRAAYIGEWALMVRAAAVGADKAKDVPKH